MIAEMVTIRDHDHDLAYPPRSGRTVARPVHVGRRVWIAAKATIVKGASVGDDAVIGAHAVVTRNIPDQSLAVGVPAVVIRHNLRRELAADQTAAQTDTPPN
jgi:acetyltransferase-like isoleucine patch superfamily enzyme